MRRLLISSSAALCAAWLSACASDEGPDFASQQDDLRVGVYDADLAKSAARRVVEHPKGEFCVALKGVPGAVYGPDDVKKEDKLCNADFYAEGPGAEDQKPTVVCPKVVSTNPGVDVFELPEGGVKTALQADASCGDPSADAPLKSLEKVGKFKQSVWCSHTGAILAAYHVSRALGNVAGVPAAVLRTMDKAEHRKVVDEGARITAARYSPKAFIRRNWNALWPCLHDGRQDCGATPETQHLYIRGPRLWDDDVEASGFQSGHLVGAFMANASEDREGYAGIGTAASVASHPAHKRLADADLGVPKQFTKDAVQALLSMKDIGDFLILDAIIEQQDRFLAPADTRPETPNISTKNFLVWQAGGEVKSERADKRKEAPPEALTVGRMVIEDNDCGLRTGQRAKYEPLLRPIRHLAPATYRGLLALDSGIEGARDTFTNGMAITGREFDRLAANVHFVTSIFKEKCDQGRLALDLDVAGYVAGSPPPSCR